MTRTPQRLDFPTVLLVGLDAASISACRDGAANAGFRTLIVGNAAAACERIPVTFPHVVVIGATTSHAEREAVTDCVVAVGAELLIAGEASVPRALASLVEMAAASALTRRRH